MAEPRQLRRSVFSLDQRDAAVIEFPDPLSCAEASDVRDWLSLVLRFIDRQAAKAEQKAAGEQHDAALPPVAAEATR